MEALVDIDQMNEDELTEYAVQLSIQESLEESKKHLKDSVGAISEQKERIFSAVKQGHVFELQQLTKYRYPFEEADERGWLPLHEAAVQPIQQIMEIVLDATSEDILEQMTFNGETALTLATEAGHVENVKLLLEKGASPYTANKNNQTPLQLAVKYGIYEMVAILLENEAPVNQPCETQWTSMHEAAKMGRTDILRLLIKHGGDVNQRVRYGVTPLSTAAEFGHAEAIELLIHKGADVNSRASDGGSVLYDAAGGGNPDCVALLLEYGASANMPSLSGYLPIHRAAYEGHYLALKTLIPATYYSAIKRTGLSPMHSAAEGGSSQCIELLLENEFDVNAVLDQTMSENYGDARKTALYFSVSNGDVTCTELLLKSGANPNRDPLNCLLVAVREGNYEIVRQLLSYGADVNCYFMAVNDTHFPSAIQYCLKDEMMMRLLLNNGYDVSKCFECIHGDIFGKSFPWTDLTEKRFSGWAPYSSRDTLFCDFINVTWLSHITGKIIRTLLDYVDFAPICAKLRPSLENQKEWKEICSIVGNPRPLKHLCRLVIRRHMMLPRLRNPASMNLLPLPGVLTQYILFSEYDLYGRNME
uniref:Ankyrin repeat and SOCS box containing 15b n=1 Tax=Erpetoichthys calabaricus TaxID=27687 RepID=A0A8C4RJA8_ERPCA